MLSTIREAELEQVALEVKGETLFVEKGTSVYRYNPSSSA